MVSSIAEAMEGTSEEELVEKESSLESASEVGLVAIVELNDEGRAARLAIVNGLLLTCSSTAGGEGG